MLDDEFYEELASVLRSNEMLIGMMRHVSPRWEVPMTTHLAICFSLRGHHARAEPNYPDSTERLDLLVQFGGVQWQVEAKVESQSRPGHIGGQQLTAGSGMGGALISLNDAVDNVGRDVRKVRAFSSAGRHLALLTVYSSAARTAMARMLMHNAQTPMPGIRQITGELHDFYVIDADIGGENDYYAEAA